MHDNMSDYFNDVYQNFSAVSEKVLGPKIIYYVS